MGGVYCVQNKVWNFIQLMTIMHLALHKIWILNNKPRSKVYISTFNFHILIFALCCVSQLFSFDQPINVSLERWKLKGTKKEQRNEVNLSLPTTKSVPYNVIHWPILLLVLYDSNLRTVLCVNILHIKGFINTELKVIFIESDKIITLNPAYCHVITFTHSFSRNKKNLMLYKTGQIRHC